MISRFFMPIIICAMPFLHVHACDLGDMQMTDSIQLFPAPDSLTAENMNDSLRQPMKLDSVRDQYRFKPLELIVPVTLIGVGVIGLESDWLKLQNHETRDELQEHPHSQLTIDDLMQYTPLAASYGLKLCGVKSRHDYVDMTVIAGTAYLLTAISVYGTKAITKVERPDGSTHDSFPSGHTATAFAGAELLRREYWETSPWIGISGYAVAAGTGFLRMYNNRHWLTDVITGAGIGILSVEAAYWLYPVITKTFFKKRYDNLFVMPVYDADGIGLSARITF